VVFTVLGGIGIFLVGMLLLTDGLKTAAGSALRELLKRFTGNRFSAVLSGAAVTALVQSSSATTLTTIGFVSAGLLSFQGAVGVIFGANLGTTSTGWIVSTIGLKVRVAEWTLPLIGVGALAWLLFSGRRAAAGMALAGFGLIFVGIGTLQTGMGELADRIDPGSFGGATLGGRLLLVGVGIAMTVVMQSSSAAIATTLAAVDAGAVTLEEAAALAIGQNVGTTVTAGIAALGATTAAKRTALAHVLFNVITGVIAFAALPAFVELSRDAADDGDPAMALAAFHTFFNLAGVLLLLPVIGPFSRLVARLVPERGPRLLADLDAAVAEVPDVGLDAARRTAGRIGGALLGAAADRAEGKPAPHAAEAAAAIEPLTRFVERIEPGDPAARQRYVSLLHAVDHLHRLAMLAEHPPAVPAAQAFPRRGPRFVQAARALAGALENPEALRGALPAAEAEAASYARWRDARRRELIERAAEPRETNVAEALAGELRGLRRWFGRPRPAEAPAPPPGPAPAAPRPPLVERLDAMLWMARVLYHGWRLGAHLDAAATGERPAPAPAEPG
jgi:phosphate:Na+ symporter